MVKAHWSASENNAERAIRADSRRPEAAYRRTHGLGAFLRSTRVILRTD